MIHPIILSIFIRTLIDAVEPERRTGSAKHLMNLLEAKELRWATKHRKRYIELLNIAQNSWRKVKETYGEEGLLADTEPILAGLYFHNQNGFKSVLKLKPTYLDKLMDTYYSNTKMEHELVSNNAVDRLIHITKQEMEK